MDGETAACASVVRGVQSPVIFDGGANLGQWDTSMHQALGSTNAKIYLFEPRSACQETPAVLAFNKTVAPVAPGSAPGEVTISGEVPGFGPSSIYERHDTYFGDMSAHQEPIPLVTLDRYASERPIDRVDLLKLDVEGAELEGTRGVECVLHDGTVRAITFEFGSANIYSRTFFRGFWELLTPLGFRFLASRTGAASCPLSGTVRS